MSFLKVVHLWVILALCSSTAFAQFRGLINQPSQELYPPPGVVPSISEIAKHINGSYAVSLMGSRFEGASNETYNIYLPDVSSIQLYHSLNLAYQVSPDLEFGVNENIVQNLVDGIVGTTGNISQKTFEWYDPNIQFGLPNLIQIPGWNVNTSASFSLPVTTASQNEARITTIIIQQSWSVKTHPSKWNYGFRLYLNPTFFNDPIPVGFTDRQTLSFSFGHNLSYDVAPTFKITTSTNFDVEHRAPNSNSFSHLGAGLPDYFQIGCSLNPNIYPTFLSIGGYFQALIWDPTPGTSIVGAKFSIGF